MTDARRKALLASDEHARRASVREFTRPLAVQAGAGTGKTSTLVARIVAWCLGPGWDRATREIERRSRSELPGRASRGVAPLDSETIARSVVDGVLAITFTEAATAELGARLRSAVAVLEREQIPDGLDADALPAREVWNERAAALLVALERPVAHTIHGFCSRLLSEHPLEAGIAPQFTIDADGEQAEAAARAALDVHLHEELAVAPGPELSALAHADIGPAEILEALRDLLRAGTRPEDLDGDPFEPAECTRHARRLAQALSALREVARPAPGASLARATRTLALLALLEPTLAAAGAAGSDGTLGSFSTLCASLRDAWSDEDHGRLSDWAKGKFNQAETRAFDERLADVAACATAARFEVQRLRRVEPEKLLAARHVLRALLARARDTLAEAGVLMHDDLLHEARALLADPEVRARLRARYTQVLVDEFQDTDPVQCALVRELAIAGPGPKPGLFLVGDPKQSIYSFRRADLAAYEGLLGELDEAGGERLTLSRNFRSSDAILDEVERVIAPVMQHVPGVQPPFEPLTGARGEKGPRVEHWIVWDRSTPAVDAAESASAETIGAVRVDEAARMEAAAVADDILVQNAAGTDFGRCAVLARTSAALEALLDAFRERDIAYDIARERGFFRRREVLDAAALLRIVVDPADHLALATALRSPHFGAPDVALLPLWSAGLPDACAAIDGPDSPALARAREIVMEVERADRGRTPPVEPVVDVLRDWSVSVADGLTRLAESRAALHAQDLDRFVESFSTRFLVEVAEAPRYQGAYRVANLERFFARLASELDRTSGDAHGLLVALRRSLSEGRDGEEARPRDTAAGAVRVLTMHGAKGLEFECVWVVGLGRGAQADRLPLAAVRRGADAPTWAFFRSATPAWSEHERERETVAAAERVRTLYVAMTRARTRLVLSGAWPIEHAVVPWEDAQTHRDLAMHSTPSELFDTARDALLAGGAFELGTALYRMCPESVREGEDGAPRAGRDAYDLERVARDRARLVELAPIARRERSRPWSRALSAGDETHGAADVERVPSAEASGREISILAGTWVHAVLEQAGHDLGADDLENLLESASRARRAAADIEDRSRRVAREAHARAKGLLARFARGELGARWRAIFGSIVARELAISARPGPDSATVGFESGAVDLVYRAKDAWVVVDYKTGGAADPDARAAHIAQARRYADVLQRSLALEAPARVEVWYLALDELVLGT